MIFPFSTDSLEEAGETKNAALRGFFNKMCDLTAVGFLAARSASPTWAIKAMHPVSGKACLWMC